MPDVGVSMINATGRGGLAFLHYDVEQSGNGRHGGWAQSVMYVIR